MFRFWHIIHNLCTMDILTIISNALQSVDTLEKLHNSGVIHKIPFYINKYFKKTIHILIVGESGSGKSQFLATIQGRKSFAHTRTRVTEKSKVVLPNGYCVRFYDTPGHQILKSERLKALNALNRRKYDGIVNIVCYGHQSVDNVEVSTIFHGDVVREDYLNANKKKELKQVEEWLERIDRDSGVKWLLTIVNKADVWFEKSDEVLSYYREGLYSQALASLQRFVKLDVIPYCSVITPFCDKPMRLVMGEKEKHALHLNFCNSISKLSEVEWPE